MSKLKRIFKKIIKNWQTIVALFALAISVKSCSVSKKANQLSQQAIEISTEQFFQENRPYIVLKPRKFTSSQNYYEYILQPEENRVTIVLQFEIRNKGNVAAKDVAGYSKAMAGKSFSDLEAIDINPPNKLTLGPGEYYVHVIKYSTVWSKESYENYVQKLSSEKGVELTVRVGVTYLSEVNPEQSFSSGVVTKITKHTAEAIDIKYEQKQE